MDSPSLKSQNENQVSKLGKRRSLNPSPDQLSSEFGPAEVSQTMKDYQEFMKNQHLKLQTLSKALDDVETRREALGQIQSVITPKVKVNA